MRHASLQHVHRSLSSFSMLRTEVQNFESANPVCRYTLHKDSLQGPAIDFASIGASVFHKWTCDTSADRPAKCMKSYSPQIVFVDRHALLVHNCKVKTEGREDVDLINSHGYAYYHSSNCKKCHGTNCPKVNF